MAELLLLEGPAGADKSAVASALIASGAYDAVSDLSRFWSALAGVERDSEGRLPVRTPGDQKIALASYLRAAAVRRSLAAGLRVIVTTASPGEVTRWQGVAGEMGAGFNVRTEDPGRAVAAQRLAAKFGGTPENLTPQCEVALNRWYR